MQKWRLHEKGLWILKRACNEDISKEENDTINKQKIGARWKQKNLLHLQNKFEHKYTNDKNYCKVKDHCHYTGKYRSAAYIKHNLKCCISKQVPVVFHNGSNYDSQFIIKDLGKEFEWVFNCLGENTEKYKNFSVSIRKEVERI